MAASILVAGAHTNLVALSSRPVTAISAAFVNHIAPNRRNNLLGLTINGGPQGSFTVVLDCSVQQNLDVDVSLGLDWTASVREWLISLCLPHDSDAIRGLVSAMKPSDPTISPSSSAFPHSNAWPGDISSNSLSPPPLTQPVDVSQPINYTYCGSPLGSAGGGNPLVVPTGLATVVPTGLATSAHPGRLALPILGEATSSHTWGTPVAVMSSSAFVSSSSTPLVVSGPSQCKSSIDGVFLSLDP
ncbi:hypothetical protein B0H19DRAFT_1238425, partial [Mycena capillaripes]